MDKINPFLDSKHYMEWETFNCRRCKRPHPKGGLQIAGCPMQEALAIASITENGGVSNDIAKRIGYNSKNKKRLWVCSSFIYS